MSNPGKPAPYGLGLTGLLGSIIAISLILVGGLGFRFGWWHFLTGINIAQWGVYLSGVALLLSTWLLLNKRAASSPIRRVAFLTVAMSLIPVGIGGYWTYATNHYPAINDISTDTEDPPVFWNMPNPSDYPGNSVAQLQREAYPDLRPLPLHDIDMEQAWSLVQNAVHERGWTLVSEDADEGQIEAVAISLLFGFEDEVAIRITETADGPLIDMRSRSRLGRIDRGVNAKRITHFFNALKRAHADYRAEHAQ